MLATSEEYFVLCTFVWLVWFYLVWVTLTHWGRATHICVSEIIIIGSDNGLSPGRRQTIIWTNVGILLIGPLGINFNEILIEISSFSFKKMHLKMSSAKWRQFRIGLNVLSAFVGWHRGILWSNINMQNSALWLTIVLPSPDIVRIILIKF